MSPELPSKTEQTISVDLDPAERKRYDDRATAFNEAIDAGIAAAKDVLAKAMVDAAKSLAASPEVAETLKTAYLDGLKAGAYERGKKAAKAGKAEGGLL